MERRKDGKTEGRKDGRTLIHRTLQATAEGPKTLKSAPASSFSQIFLHTKSPVLVSRLQNTVYLHNIYWEKLRAIMVHNSFGNENGQKGKGINSNTGEPLQYKQSTSEKDDQFRIML